MLKPCVCTTTLPCASSLAADSEELNGFFLATPQQEKYKSYVSDIIEKQSELDEILPKLEAVNLFQDDRDNDNGGYGISWSKYLPYTIGELEKPATICLPSHVIDGPVNAMVQFLCNDPNVDVDCDSSVSMTSTPSFRPSISSMPSLVSSFLIVIVIVLSNIKFVSHVTHNSSTVSIFDLPREKSVPMPYKPTSRRKISRRELKSLRKNLMNCVRKETLSLNVPTKF